MYTLNYITWVGVKLPYWAYRQTEFDLVSKPSCLTAFSSSHVLLDIITLR